MVGVRFDEERSGLRWNGNRVLSGLEQRRPCTLLELAALGSPAFGSRSLPVRFRLAAGPARGTYRVVIRAERPGRVATATLSAVRVRR